MSSYGVGQPVVIYIDDIANAEGVATNPATIVLTLRRPDGNVETYQAADLTHTGTGAYEFVKVPAAGQGGTWAWRFEHTNPTSAEEGTFNVRESPLAGPDGNQPITGPCGYWTGYDEVAARGTLPATASAEAVYQAIAAASDVCFQLGGRRWPGVCDATVQVTGGGGGMPLPLGGGVSRYDPSSWGGTGLGWWGPFGGVGAFYCGGRGQRLVLPGPILSITEIREDGVVLDAANYVVVDWEAVVRTDGKRWPSWNLADTAIPALEIDYSYGQAPPEAGRIAATALAFELVLAFTGSDDCRLDRRVKSIVREGLSEQVGLGLPGIAETLRDGQTGIPEVDLFVHAHNPTGLRRPARILGLSRGGHISRRS